MSQPKTPAESTSSPIDTTHLFDEFSPVSRQAWEALIRKDLKLETPADYERKTLWRTSEGFTVQPFYDRADLAQATLPDSMPGQLPFLRGNHTENNAWEIREEIYDVGLAAANRRARTALEAGVDSVAFVFTAERGVLYGVDLTGDVSSSFQKLVDGIWLDAAGIHFRSGIAAPLALTLLSEEVRRQKLDPAKITGSVGFDPMSELAREGELDVAAAANLAVGLVQFANERLPGVRTLCVSDAVFHNAGAGIVESLALTLAAGNDLLARLTDAAANGAGKSISVAEICGSLAFDFSISANYFMEIARLRAARLLWARIVQAYAPDAGQAAAMYIHGRTSAHNQTMYDPHVNLLRATTETMAAALGACDAFTVAPFDLALHPNGGDEFSARMARNTQQVLKHEAYLDKVIDPAAGSYYLETLTDQIARKAWESFQEIEAAGGFVAAFQSGAIQTKIAASATRAREAVASRKQTILGTNQYPNAADRALNKLESDKLESASARTLPAGAGAASPAKLAGTATPAERIQFIESLPALASKHGVAAILADLRGTPDVSAAPLQTFRIAEDFERLRLATERYVAGGGQTPRVYLLTFGDLAMRKARSMFAANFFACAGFESIDSPGQASPEAGVDAALASGARIVVLCSSDAEYAEQARAAATRLRAAGTVQVVVAGNPVEEIDRLREAGVQFFVHAKSNVLEVLGEFQKVLGI